MTTALQERPVLERTTGRDGGGGAPARRAVVRWAWRMFRREWRRQALILALLTVAVAATVVGLALINNTIQLGPDAVFGTANTVLTLNSASQTPAATAADIVAIQHRFGTIDVISHQSIPVPGSATPIDLRAENPAGPFVRVTVRLDSGHYPIGPNQVAVTESVATTFDLHVGGVWQEGGRSLQVVGVVENPLNLLDQFALVAPGQANPPTSVSVLFNAPQGGLRGFNLPSGQGLNVGTRGSASKTAAEALVLVLATVGLIFVGLLAVAGFAVMAQRRMRALGMLSSLGATDRQVRLVMLANGAAVGATSAIAGAVVGLAVWFALASSVQSTVERRVDRLNLPWWAVGMALLLAFLTSIIAAWWPARAVSRVPIMAALAGRPPRPQPAHRFATAGAVLFAGGLVLLYFKGQHQALFIISGTIVTVVGLLLLAPFAIQAVARLAGQAPISVRLALRDLARYQARSGAALGAATLAVAIAATIAISAAASQAPSPVSNLPANQLLLTVGSNESGPGNPIPVLTSAQNEAVQAQVDQLATALHAQNTLPIEAAVNLAGGAAPADPGPGGQSGGYIAASMAQVSSNSRGESISPVASLYVATPALLAHFGINPSQISPSADLITSRTDLGGMQIFLPTFGNGPGPGPGSRSQLPSAETNPDIQILPQLPGDTSEPNVLLTSHAMQVLGLQSTPGGWLLQTPQALTTAQIDTAQKLAGSAGLTVETKQAPKSLAPLRNWSTAAGIMVALGVLAMTVGLIRSETANDLRTLSASGASSTTRRGITGATSGALALLGAVLGTAGAYAALLVWYRSDLHPLTQVPVVNLVVIVVALPVIATAGGWLLAGREPPGLARQPIE